MSWLCPKKELLESRLEEELEGGGDTIRWMDKPEYWDKVCGWGHAVFNSKVKEDNNDTMLELCLAMSKQVRFKPDNKKT